jgi:hypothetical protein
VKGSTAECGALGGFSKWDENARLAGNTDTAWVYPVDLAGKNRCFSGRGSYRGIKMKIISIAAFSLMPGAAARETQFLAEP